MKDLRIEVSKDLITREHDVRSLGKPFSKDFYNELKRFFSKGNRRTGRSYMLAKILVDTAIETNDEIYLLDHWQLFGGSNRHLTYYLSKTINDIIRYYRESGLDLLVRGSTEEKFSIKISEEFGNLQLFLKLRNNYEPMKFEEENKVDNNINKKLLLLCQ